MDAAAPPSSTSGTPRFRRPLRRPCSLMHTDLPHPEAKVLQSLIQGKRLEDMSRDFHLSINTLRTHLKPAFPRQTMISDGLNADSSIIIKWIMAIGGTINGTSDG